MDQMKMRCFMTLAQTLNFTKAAEQIYLTQQAVSHSIAALEQELQLQLFERNTRSVRLTPEGASLYAFLNRVGGEYHELIEDLRKRQHPFSMHVGYQNFISFYNRLRQALGEMTAEYPDLVMDVDRHSPAALRKKLQQHELDLIVIYRRFFNDQESYNILPLCDIRQYYMVAEDVPIPEDDPLPTLRSQPFIIDRVENETPAELKARIVMERERWGLTGSTVIVSDRDSAYTQAEMGRGVLVGTDLSIMASGRALKRYNCGFTEQLVAVWRKGENNPIIAKYAQALSRAYSQKDDT